MPIYEYQCGDCHSEFELLIRSNERPECPHCGGIKLRKEFSVPAASSGSAASDLPICDVPSPGGGCGLPACHGGHCQFD